MRISVFFLRLVCCLLACLLLIPVALADVPDISALTDDEILALLDQVNQEVVTRGLNKTAKLPQGSYIGGKDLPVGRYIFTCMATGDDWGNVTIYSDRGEGKQLMWNVVTAPEEGEEPDTIYITLNEGDQLKSGVAFSLTIMAAVAFR